MKKLLKRILGKKISCKLGLHNWKVIKSIKLSNIIFSIKKHHQSLSKVNYDLDYDYIVYDRECIDCKLQDFNIDKTKKVILNKLNEMIMKKFKNKKLKSKKFKS